MLCGVRYPFRLIDLRAFAGGFPHGLRNSSNHLSRLPIEERRYGEGDLAANLAAELRYTPPTNSG
jgi:hypothetical protein